jgi:hypothetical protein
MGLAPNGNGENPGKSAVAKVPVPIFSQPRRAGIGRRAQAFAGRHAALHRRYGAMAHLADRRGFASTKPWPDRESSVSPSVRRVANTFPKPKSQTRCRRCSSAACPLRCTNCRRSPATRCRPRRWRRWPRGFRTSCCSRTPAATTEWPVQDWISAACFLCAVPKGGYCSLDACRRLRKWDWLRCMDARCLSHFRRTLGKWDWLRCTDARCLSHFRRTLGKWDWLRCTDARCLSHFRRTLGKWDWLRCTDARCLSHFRSFAT